MAATIPELPASPTTSFGSNFANMFQFLIDPQSAARCVFRKHFWIAPLLLLSVITLVSTVMLQPIIDHVMDVTPAPPGVDAAQYQKSMGFARSAQHIGGYLSPLVIAAILAIQALIIFATCAGIGVKAKFGELFNLVCGAGLISLGLTSIANVIILKTKADVESLAELKPALGLDIFLPETANKFLLAFLGYFSIFNVWWIVMVILIFSAAYRVSKGKAAVAIAPAVILGLMLTLGGAIFKR